MSFELVYTSAPKGLKSGSRGFCTVACTRGMPQPLMTALESMSAYRHVYPPGDRNAAKNPIAWSHVKMNVAGRAYHVLSRIADFGLDYSQRGNKLAHHVALESSEQSSGGPASLLSQTGNMETTWEGEPRLLPSGPRLRAGSRPPAVCTAWQSFTGDAGWAGVLAEAFLANPERQVYIVFGPGMDLLPLMTEAISLLPAERRWDVTFSTYFTALPPGANCAWRCVLAGSPEADQGRKFAKALHIDLTQPLPPAVGGELVEAAKSGRTVVPPTGPPKVGAVDPDGEWDLQPTAEEGRALDPDNVHFSEGSAAAQAGYNVFRPAGMPPPPPPQRRRTLADVDAADAARRRRRIQLTAIALTAVLIVIGVAVATVPPLHNLVIALFNREQPADDAIARDGKSKRPAQDDDAEQEPGEPKSPETVAKTAPADSKSDSKSDTTAKSKDTQPAAAKDGKTVDTAHDRQKSLESGARPEFAGKPLNLVRVTEEYELYAISIDDAVKKDLKLRFPERNSSSVKLAVAAPRGRTDIKSDMPPGIDSELRIQRNIPLGTTDWARVFSFSKSSNNGDCLIGFTVKAEEWDVLRWCLLIVEEPDRKMCLIALQNTILAWKPQLQFNNSSLTLPFPRQDDWTSLRTLKIDSVRMHATRGEQSFAFDNPTADGGNVQLSCPVPAEQAKQILFVQQNPEIKLTAKEKDDQVQLTTFDQIDDWNALFDAGLEDRLKQLSNRLNQQPLANESSLMSLLGAIDDKKLKNELKQDKANPGSKTQLGKLKDVLQSIRGDYDVKLRTAKSDGSPESKQHYDTLVKNRDQVKEVLDDVERLEKARAEFKAFKESLQSADLTELSLHYEFEIQVPGPANRPAKRSVPVKLHYHSK